MKRIIGILVLFLFLLRLVSAASSVKDDFDILRFKEMQILAINVEVMLPLGWSDNDKRSIKLAGNQAIHELNILKKDIVKLDVLKEAGPYKDTLLGLIDRFAKLYTNLDKKGEDEIKQGYDGIRSYSETQSKYVGSVYSKYIEQDGDGFPDNFDPTKEEAKYVSSTKDGMAYLSAINFIKERKFKEAHAVLLKLEPKYKNSAFGTCVSLRISDCLIWNPGEYGDESTGKEILAEIVNKQQYTPILFEAFKKWRSVTQSHDYGVSNMSLIPNDEYNAKRWELIQTIKGYLKKNPDDVWAKAQINLLLALPNIGRGGAFGNDNLIYYAELYSDISEKTKGEK
ncbi:MAG: hypothetical protein AB1668_07045 [Nanoarchaeota archaeon]